MEDRNESLIAELSDRFSFRDLDRALIYKGAQAMANNKELFDKIRELNDPYQESEGIDDVYASPAPPHKELEAIDLMMLGRVLNYKLGKTDLKGKTINKGVCRDDRRNDYIAVEDDKIRANADRTAIICSAGSLLPATSDYYLFTIENYKDKFGLCTCEPYHDQPMVKGQNCTGFLLAPDIVATAGHCPAIRRKPEDVRVVFGYKSTGDGQWAIRVKREDVYTITDVIEKDGDKHSTRPDFALLKLSRAVEDRSPVKLSTVNPQTGHPVYAVGHPRSIPVKVAPGKVTGDFNSHFFQVDTDIFSGNSGSPLFDGITHQLAGIVTKGYGMDFRFNGSCFISVIYTPDGQNFKWPRCTKLDRIREFLNKR